MAPQPMEHSSLTAAVAPCPLRTTAAARVVIADDERIFRASLRRLLELSSSTVSAMFGVEIGSGFDVVGEAGTGQETVEVVQSTHPDLMLLDVCMPRRSGLEALRELQRCDQPRHTIILSGALDAEQLVTAIQLGARGVVRKDAPTELLFAAITSVIAGASWVDQRLTSDLLDAVRGLGQLRHRGNDQAPPHADFRQGWRGQSRRAGAGRRAPWLRELTVGEATTKVVRPLVTFG
jgi:DNA-binding NarL/FixJ family response regulator